MKVLPKDTPKEKLRAVMTGFSRSLGVRCQHCHVGKEGEPLSSFDFVSDENPKKGVARDMLRMLGHINTDLREMKLEGTRRVNMWCHTCHHGRPRPATLVEELTWTYQAAGLDSTLRTYQTLRDQFYGRAAYDFGEGSLAEVGSTLLEQGKNEDALRVLVLNVEQFPRSATVHAALARAYEKAGQTDRALESYRKALELDPGNRQAEQKIRELSGSGARE